MTDLITLNDARLHLRVDTTDDDAAIQAYITAASASIYTYIGDQIYTDNTHATIRPDVMSACKLLVGDLYRFRDSSSRERGEGSAGYLPVYVMSLLYPYREPSASS